MDLKAPTLEDMQDVKLRASLTSHLLRGALSEEESGNSIASSQLMERDFSSGVSNLAIDDLSYCCQRRPAGWYVPFLGANLRGGIMGRCPTNSIRGNRDAIPVLCMHLGAGSFLTSHKDTA